MSKEWDGKFFSEDDRRRYWVIPVVPPMEDGDRVSVERIFDKDTRTVCQNFLFSDKDVFDHLACFFREKDSFAKILFPFCLHTNHWILCEVIIEKNEHIFRVQVMGHDAFASQSLPAYLVHILEQIITRRITASYDQFITGYFTQVSSPYSMARQSAADVVSCSVCVVHELVERIRGRSLDSTLPYAVGLQEIRNAHLRVVQHYFHS